MTVLDYLLARRREGRVHMTLLDPEKRGRLPPGELAAMAADLGTDVIMVGGSTGVSQTSLDACVKEIKAAVDLPVILFPANARTLSPYADAVYFMSLLNSRTVRLLIREQQRAAQAIRDMGLETIAMGYVVVEPGMKVGEVGEAELIPRDRPGEAVGYALAAQFFGMDLFYLEAGSGAPEPVPPDMVRAVRAACDLPLVVGGGIRRGEAARRLVEAGADAVVTGTVVEEEGGKDYLREILDAVKGR